MALKGIKAAKSLHIGNDMVHGLFLVDDYTDESHAHQMLKYGNVYNAYLLRTTRKQFYRANQQIWQNKYICRI